MLGWLLLVCTWIFRSGGEIAGVIPTGATFQHFGDLLASAGKSIAQVKIPVDNTDGLVFIAVLGISVMAILTDIFVSIMRMPTMAGIPMLILYLVPVAILPQSLPWVLFVPGAVGYLWLLLTDNIDRVRRYGRRFAGDGRGIDRWEPSPLAGTGRWMAAFILPVTLLLPLIMPGVTTGFIEGWYNGNGSGHGDGGETSTVDPVSELEGALSTPQTIELGYVETDDKSPGYMKMWTASNLSEKGFTADTRQSEQTMAASKMSKPKMREDVKRREWKATFTVTGMKSQALPLFSSVSSIDVEDDWGYDPVANTVTSESSDSQDMKFNYTFIDFDPSPEQLRSASKIPNNSSEYVNNIRRPESSVVKNIVEDLVAGEETQYDKVLAIHRFFSRDNGFRYELSTGEAAGAGTSAIEKFLTTGKAGYCQQYAASMAWMVRAADIPSRVAIGLTRGTASADGYRVTNYNYHAWVEVYFEGFGWIPFDPTPASGVRNSESSQWAPDPNSSGSDNSDEDSGDGGDNSSNTGDKPDAKPGEGGDATNSSSSTVTLTGNPPAPIWPYWTAAAVLIALLLLAPAMARAGRRRRRLAAADADPVRASGAAWDDLLDTLADLRLSTDESETSRALANRLIKSQSLSGTAAIGLRHLAAAYERSRYAARPPGGLSLRAALEFARYGLLASQPAMTRLTAELLPVSTLSHWRRAVSRITRGGTGVMVRLRLIGHKVLNRLAPGRRRNT